MISRCKWCENSFDQYIAYHDKEWGVPSYEDTVHFEFLVLEGAQAGLSWATILKKREGYRRLFSGFDVGEVARFKEDKVNTLLGSKEVVRNRQKITGAIQNAKRFIDVQREFGSFTQYIWSFVGGSPIINHWRDASEVPTKTDESERLSSDLRKRGFKFVGPIIMYSHMQATGLVNDHTVDCFRHKELC